MTFAFKVQCIHFEATGLSGGSQEYDPFLGVHGTFPPHQIQEKVPLFLCKGQKEPKQTDNVIDSQRTIFGFDKTVLKYETRGPLSYTLTHDKWTRGDESLWFEVYCHTRERGIAELTEKESSYIECELTTGLFQLTVQTMLQRYVETGKKVLVFTQTIVDDLTVRLKMQEYTEQGEQITQQNRMKYIEKAMQETAKGELYMEVAVTKFDQQLYPHTIFAQKNLLTTALSAVLPEHKRKHHSEKTTTLAETNKKTHHRHHNAMPSWLYTSEKGIEKMSQAMVNHIWTPYSRHHIKLDEHDPEPKWRPLNAHIGQLHMIEWVGKYGPGPTHGYWTSKDVTTREYASEEKRQRDLDLYGFDHRTERVLETLLRASIRRYGANVKQFEQEVYNHFAADNRATEPTAYFLLCERIIVDCGTSAAHSGNYMSDMRFVPERTRRKRTHLVINDQWSHPMLQIGSSDDCDGEECTAAHVLRAYGTGRHTLNFQWESSLLNAVKLYLKHTVIYDVGATVTSAYMDDNHKKTNINDLPMVDDARDKASECGGHCHSLVEPLLISLQRLRHGHVPRDVLDSIAAVSAPLGAAFLERDCKRHTLVLEPTGSIDETILPVKEVYEKDPVGLKKTLAVRQFTRMMGARGQDVPDVSGMYTGEGLAYYTEKQEERRRITGFYNEVVHVICNELGKFDMTLSQMTLLTRVQGNWCYGAKIADLLRHRDRHALMSAFMPNREEWKRHVKPLLETLQHQMPFMSFGRYTDEQNALICSRYNLTEEVGHGCMTSQKETLRVKKEAAFEKLIAQAADNPNHAVVRLYSRLPLLERDGKKTDVFKKYLQETPGLIDHAYYTMRHLPPSPYVMEILAVIDVEVCLSLQTK
jgi:hypothetical protein